MGVSGNDHAYVRLLATVEAQQGYFTTKQAIKDSAPGVSAQ
jgi:hypothetical protein